MVPFAIAVLSPITLPAFLWWAAALNQLPQQLALVAALLLHVRFLQTGRARNAVGAALTIVAGLLFSEKTLFVVPLIVAFTLLYAVGGSPQERLKATVRRHWPAWVAYLAIALPYAAYYVIAVPSPARQGATFADTGSLVTKSFTYALVPGLLGGPWTWTPIGFAGALAGPGGFARALALVVVVLVVVGSVLARHRAIFGWLLAFGYALMNVGLLAVSRATLVGPVIGQEFRYFTDLALVSSLGLALAVMPIDGHWRRGDPQRLSARPWSHHRLSAALGQARTWLPHRLGELLTVGLVAALTASSVVSSMRYDRYWSPNPSRAYLQTVEFELAHPPDGLVLYDNNVPGDVAWALLGEYARMSRVFAALPDSPRYLEAGQTTQTLRTLDQTGRIRLAGIDGFRNTKGPVPQCGWLLGHTPVSIPLERTTSAGDWVVRIGYLASEDTTVEIDTGQAQVRVPFVRGLGAVWFLSPGPVAALQVTAGTSSGTVCTDDVTVGLPVAFPGTR